MDFPDYHIILYDSVTIFTVTIESQCEKIYLLTCIQQRLGWDQLLSCSHSSWGTGIYCFHIIYPSVLSSMELYSGVQLALVALSDAHPASHRRSRVWFPLGLATFFCGDWSWNIFYGHSLPSADYSRRAVVRFWLKNAQILVNRLEEKYWLAAQEKCGWVSWLTRHDPNGLTGS